MLFTPDGKQINRVPDTADFKEVVRMLGDRRTAAVRREVNRIIDAVAPDKETGRRTFGSSHVGEQLKPWPYPLAGLYDVALDIEGNTATGRHVYDRAVRIFELFVWECIMARKEKWMCAEQNVNPPDPDRAIADTVYREHGSDETITGNR